MTDYQRTTTRETDVADAATAAYQAPRRARPGGPQRPHHRIRVHPGRTRRCDARRRAS